MAKTKINKVYVVGTIQEVNTTVRQSNGRDYINGKIVVKVDNGMGENLVEMKVLSFAKNKDGGDNKMFQTYVKLDGMQGKKVKLTGEFRDGSMINQTDGKVRHFNEIYLKFVNPARADEPDCATFEYSGFVVKGIYERKNKEDELLGYRIEVAQANYNDTNMQVIRFDIAKDDINIAQAIEASYEVGSTVSFSGAISYQTHTEQKVQEMAFGDPVVKTYVVSDKMFRITSGTETFDADNPATYTREEIKSLVEAYKQADVDRLTQTTAAEAAPATSMSKLTRTSSLI